MAAHLQWIEMTSSSVRDKYRAPALGGGIENGVRDERAAKCREWPDVAPAFDEDDPARDEVPFPRSFFSASPRRSLLASATNRQQPPHPAIGDDGNAFSPCAVRASACSSSI